MGLLELLQQGQTQLSAGSFPGDTPINDPQSGFIQNNSIYNSYENETLGQPNNGSVLANTLNNTALDNTNPSFNTPTFPPTTDNNYPELTSGEFNGAPSQYEPLYNINNTYLDNLPIQDDDSPQLNTLEQTGLDNTNANALETTIVPDSISYPNNYPTITDVYLGEFRGAPSPYETIYNPDNTYLVDVPIQTPNSPQIPTLDQTSLDNADTGNVSTTNPVPNANTFPNNYPILSPQTGMGKFGLQPNQYYTIWAPNNKYYSQFNYNNIITNSSNPLVNYVNLTGLTLDPNDLASFVQTYPFNQTYLGSPGFPPFVTGQFNGAPSIFQGTYDTGNIYLNNVPIKTSNSPQLYTLDNTGLDNTDSNADETTFTPNSITAPNNYPSLVSGEFNGAPSQYISLYSPENTYLDSISIQDPNSSQIPTLGETGLDLDNSEYSPTAIQPSSIAYPNNYPAIEGVNLGGFGGPEQYDTNWNQGNTYLNSFNQDSENSIQLGFIGSNLDNSSAGVSTLSHVIPPSSVYKPTVYPIIPQVNLGEFNAGPSQYATPYSSTDTYLSQYDELKNINTNPQTNTLDETALDVENPDSLLTSLIYAPTNPDTITEYPASNVTGATGSYAQGFNQVWRPIKRYYNDYIKPLKDQNLV